MSVADPKAGLMASSEQPADSWEDLDKLALDKLSLGEKKAKTPAAENNGVGGSR